MSPPPKTEPARVFLASILIFCVASLYLCWPWISGQVTIPWDAKAHFQPQLSFLAHSLHRGAAPFWTPNVFAGMPQIADPQSLIFAPLYLALAALVPEPNFQEADGVAFLMLTLGGIGWMLYFRDRGWRAAGGLVAALAFAYGGSAAWRIQHTGQILSLSWFPLAFWALNRALDRASFGWGMVAGLFAAFMVLGRDQIAWLFCLVLAAFVVYRAFAPPLPDGLGAGKRFLNMLKPLAGGTLVGLIVAGPALLWTIALAEQSNRSEITLEGAMRGSLHPASVLTAFVADLFNVHGPLSGFWGPPSPGWGETGLYIARNMGELYFGALPVAMLLVFGLGRGWVFRRPAAFFLGALLVMYVYAIGKYTPVFPALFDVPGANLFRRPADATFQIGAFAAVLGGACVSDYLNASAGGRRAPLGYGLLGAVLLACVGVAVVKGHSEAFPAIGFALVCFALSFAGLFAARRLEGWPTLALLLIALPLTFDLSLNNRPNQSTALPPETFDVLREGTGNETIGFLKQKLSENTAPDRRDRVELAGIDFHWPNAGLTHGFDMDLGYNPIRLSLFVDVTHAIDHVALPEQRVFSPAFPSYKSPMANLMGLRWIAAGVPAEQIDKSLKPGDLPLIKQTADAFIYENKDALPRVLLPGRAVAADFAALERDGGVPDIDYRHNVLIDRADCARLALQCQEAPATAADGARPEGQGDAKITTYENTFVEVEARAPAGGGFLVLNDVWQDWQAVYVDGVEADLLKANLMFRAVKLTPGAHKARFQFEPMRAFRRFLPGGAG
ncbi:hypothetical protein CCR94_16835 [Rhodoblastus sphagnicola]|uniref:YfhO family protein n=1 Tax=Rhodoblastus sphagnicola TaxID=333368 RepID=A0A2S6N2B4_9HYPH|nr:hypothetical protein [Rhodoblastus sphagnicola]MBB4197346.1 hypothetical protein [Rhodoblastus sphagnicola]PPQ28753.1 hypothetical protein CCR94_16835 [Rhodoblastus sphagnicola]